MRAPCSRPYSTSRMIKLNLNGPDTTVGVDADAPLLWVREVPQCGSLAHTPQPSDADLDAAMSGNLCRCGTYQRIRAAIHRAATLKAGARKELS